MRISDLDPQEIIAWMRDHFIVDSDRGILVWLVPPKNHGRMLGKEAGSVRNGRSGKNYVHVKKDRIALKRGWLIFLWVNGRWPNGCIDHINGNSTDDRSVNLREATITENAWNHKSRKRRIQLPMGVRTTKGVFGYQARISYRKQQIHLGTFKTVEDARSAYLAKRQELYREFA
jgi:hypothetical protein